MSEETRKLQVHRSRKRVYESLPEEASLAEVPQNLSASTTVPAEETTTKPVIPDNIALIPIVTQPGMKPLGQNTGNSHQSAMLIVRRWSGWAAGIGLLPVPVVDMVAMVAVQIAMLRKLAEFYNIPFHEQRSKSAVAALIGGVNAGYLGGSLLKMVPVFGVLSLAAMPVVNGAIAYAVGCVFIQHFASGGTFLDFDPDKVKTYFVERYEEGKLNPR